jgi:hypothetical protein
MARAKLGGQHAAPNCCRRNGRSEILGAVQAALAASSVGATWECQGRPKPARARAWGEGALAAAQVRKRLFN